MPDGLDDLLIEAAGGTPEPKEPDPVPPADPEPEPVEPEVTPEPTDPVPPEKKPNPMKEVRDRLNSEQKAKERIEKTVERFTSGDYSFKIRDFKTEDGKVDYEALSKAMDEADLKVKAESRGISPEVQAEIDRIQQEKVELQRERLRVSMDRALSDMQVDMSLKREDIAAFFKDSMALKKNPYQWLAQGGSLPDLYYLVYKEKLIKAEVDKAVEEAKAKWEESSAKKPPITNPAKPAQQSRANSGMSLEDMLSQAIK